MSSGLYPVLFRYPAGTPGPLALVGSFNHWDPGAHRLTRVDRVWRITVYLPAGVYPYAFVREGQFVKDPDPLRSAAGARYSVLRVGDRPKPAGRVSRGPHRANGVAVASNWARSRGGNPAGVNALSLALHSALVPAATFGSWLAWPLIVLGIWWRLRRPFWNS